MQKKIIALAIAASFSAPAFADVGLYGIVDAALASVTAKGQKSDMIALAGGASTSRLGWKATEDLGNGLTGVAVLEYALNTETAAGSTAAPACTVTGAAGATCSVAASSNGSGIGAARQQMLAVAGSFGTVATGYLQTTGYDWGGKYDPISGSAVSSLQVAQKGFLIGATAVASRAPRALAYISPNMNGLVVAVNYTTSFDNTLGNLGIADATNTGLKTTAYLMSANYDMGPLSVGGVYAATANASTGANHNTEWAIGGSYDLGVAKILGTYQSDLSSASGAVANKAYSLSGVMPVATGAFAVTYAASKIGTSSAPAGNANGSSVTVGYLHTLTKSTIAYVAYQSVSNGSATNAYSADNNALANANLTAGGSSSVLALGLRKKF